MDKNLLESKDKRGAAKDPQDREEHQNQPLKDEGEMVELQPGIFPLTNLAAARGEAEVANVGHHHQHFHQVEDPDNIQNSLFLNVISNVYKELQLWGRGVWNIDKKLPKTYKYH